MLPINEISPVNWLLLRYLGFVNNSTYSITHNLVRAVKLVK